MICTKTELRAIHKRIQSNVRKSLPLNVIQKGLDVPEVKIQSGHITGAVNDGIYAFKGIPFAAPISGENRWLPPQPVTPWSGTKDATSYGEICPQPPALNKWLAGSAGKKYLETIDATGPQGDDCLNLNIWTSSLDGGAKLPVMVWIHGGAFVAGASSIPIYDGENLAKKGVVLVSINYRLGLMGSFFAPDMFDDDYCGPNRGFEDQLAALRWVQENIEQFGGDPSNVTIFGESAGGQSIAVLVASPKSKGLFKRAIAQSGTPEFCTPYADHRIFCRDLLNKLGIKEGDRSALAEMSAQDTIKAMDQARRLTTSKDAESKYGELVRSSNLGCVYGTEFMPVHILDSMKQGTAKDIDYMLGTVMEDGRLFQLVMPGPEPFSAWASMKMFKNLIQPLGSPKEVFAQYKAAMPGASDSYVRGQIMTDVMFRRGTVRAAELHSQTAPGKTFLYQFNWTSPVPGIGSMHGLEIAFCNQNLEAFSKVLGDIEPLRAMSDTVSDAWVSFAKTGTPSANMPTWTPFDTQNRATMVFNDTISLEHDVDRHLRDLWYKRGTAQAA